MLLILTLEVEKVIQHESLSFDSVEKFHREREAENC